MYDNPETPLARVALQFFYEICGGNILIKRQKKLIKIHDKIEWVILQEHLNAMNK